MASLSANETLRALEWPRFLEYAVAEARTEPAKTRIQALTRVETWATDVATAKLHQQETQEVAQLLERDSLWGPLADLPDPETVLERLGRGAVLEVVELALLRRWLYAVDSWTQVPREEIRGERFKRALLQLTEPFDSLKLLDRLLTPEGELSENASPKLSAIHAEIRALRREISNTLDHLMKTLSTKGVLQENFTDVRDGRYVLPIKISSQNEVDGIIYEASVSRQTVFVEPREVAPMNNRLRQRQNDLIQEIYIILTEASKRLQPFAPEFSLGVEILCYWDAVQAKARLGRKFSGKPLQISEGRGISLQQTAHPLLWWSLPIEKIIRNDVKFGGEFGESTQTLLLTGPNTGGKTVLLKTLGMAAICARTGFPFPAVDQPVVPLFDSVFADLGDPQSIEQHLSSFSGHIMRFKDAIENVSKLSLVLIDELNTATDPEEGAALGRAFLETIMSKGALVVCTTHDPHLKALAINDSRILNASLAFDEGSRSPTYRVILGVPGRSRALETAERLGIPKDVLELARSYLSKGHLAFEGMLSRLETDVAEAARAKRDAVLIREEAEKMKKDWLEKTQSSVGDMLEKTRQRLRRILEQAQDEVRSSVRKLDEMKNRKELDQTRSSLNQAFGTAASRLETALAEEAPSLAQTLEDNLQAAATPAAAASDAPTITVGTTVRVPKWKTTGVILEVAGNKVKVAMGALQVSLGITDVDPLSAAELQSQQNVYGTHRPKSSKRTTMETPAPPDSQLDLRGVRLDEAMIELERYLDLAFRSGALAEVTIVHGLGTGAIREGSRKFLKKLPYVKNFRDGGLGAGGSGATIVEFDRD